MLEPIINTQSAKVVLTYPLLLDFELQMDFNPIIDWFQLKGYFCLLHWQAKPFGERRWGVYDSKTDSYWSLLYDQLQIRAIPRLLQVDETTVKSVPTAVLYFSDSRLMNNACFHFIATN